MMEMEIDKYYHTPTQELYDLAIAQAKKQGYDYNTNRNKQSFNENAWHINKEETCVTLQIMKNLCAEPTVYFFRDTLSRIKRYYGHTDFVIPYREQDVPKKLNEARRT